MAEAGELGVEEVGTAAAAKGLAAGPLIVYTSAIFPPGTLGDHCRAGPPRPAGQLSARGGTRALQGWQARDKVAI